VTPLGACAAAMTPGEEGKAAGAAGGEGGDNSLIVYLIPAVVIAALLLIAIVVACVLYRSRRRGKMRMTDSGTYVSRGIPVIFADELEERQDHRRGGKPVILSSERPPEPPAYPQTPPPGTKAETAPMLDKNGEANTEAPYERPPPVAAPQVEANRPGRGQTAANSRQPPPYVPP